MTMNTNVVVSCAVTGAGDTVDKHPAIPVTPEQIANSAIEAADAGAAIVHLHVRDPETGKGSRDINLFKETVELVRNSGRNVLINLTAGMGGDLVVDDENPEVRQRERISSVPKSAWRMWSCCARISRRWIAASSTSTAPITSTSRPPICCGPWPRYAEIGVKPEMEVFDLGRLRFANQMVSEGLIKGRCTRYAWVFRGAPARIPQQ